MQKTYTAPIPVSTDLLPGWVKLLLICSVLLHSSGLALGGTFGAWQTSVSIEGNLVSTGTWATSTPLGPIVDFAVFGAGGVTIVDTTETAANTSIAQGFIGSNSSVSLGSGNEAFGVRAFGTVSTANNADIGQGGIIANNAVSLGSGTKVASTTHGGSVSAQSNTVLARVVSGGALSLGSNAVATSADAQSASLSSNAKVLGTLTLPNAVSPSLGSGATVGTLENDGDPLPASPAAFAQITLPAPNAFSASTDAGKDITLSAGNSPLTLPPGMYRDFSSVANQTLNLSAGAYVFNTMSFGSGNEIYIDVTSGPVHLFVVGNVTTAANTKFFVTGGDASKVYLESKGVIEFGSGNEWRGTAYSTKADAPGANGIKTAANTLVEGALYSNQQADIGSGNDITLVGPYFGTYAAPTGVSPVVLNELYPNPAGGPAPNNREWIELYNNSASSVDLLGWKVSELSGASEKFYTIVASSSDCASSPSTKAFPYAAGTSIAANGILVLQFCSGSDLLNNNGDTVRLYDSAGAFMDGHAYPSTAAGKSHARFIDGTGVWVDPEPTPGEQNRFSRADLAAAGFSDAEIEQMVALLASRGEYLIGEEPIEQPADETATTTAQVPEGEQASSTPQTVENEQATSTSPGVSGAGGGASTGFAAPAAPAGETPAANEPAAPTGGEEEASSEPIKKDDEEQVAGEQTVPPPAQEEPLGEAAGGEPQQAPEAQEQAPASEPDAVPAPALAPAPEPAPAAPAAE